MYSRRPNFVLGFHGCDEKVRNAVVGHRSELKPSENIYDWIGHGFYFWENNPTRALSFAEEKRTRSTGITSPSVLGAVIDLGHCLDLLDADGIAQVKAAYELLLKIHEKRGSPIPTNNPVGKSSDILLRNLDCAVVETLHKSLQENNQPPYDTVRAMFVEGSELYDGAGFRDKNHIQLCVRNPNCIKGFFIPRRLDKRWTHV